jgi:hypothetical protein
LDSLDFRKRGWERLDQTIVMIKADRNFDSIMHYNFCRIHQSLRVTHAIESGVTDHVESSEESGAVAPTSMGTKVNGGMLVATLIAIFLIPVTYYVVECFADRRR